jgi:hypothetical protein
VRPVSLFIPSIDYYQQVWMRNHLKSLANVRGVSVCVSVFPGWQFIWPSGHQNVTRARQTNSWPLLLLLFGCTRAQRQSSNMPSRDFHLKEKYRETQRERERIIWCVGLLGSSKSSQVVSLGFLPSLDFYPPFGCPPSPGWIIDMTKLALLLWLFGVCRLQWHSLSVCTHKSIFSECN